MTLTLEDRIGRARREGIPARLFRGAAVLGRLWREGQRCGRAWAWACECAPPLDFCGAKMRWCALLLDLAELDLPAAEGIAETDPADPHFVVLNMTVRQLAVAGVTLVVAPPAGWALAPIRFDAKGLAESWPTLFDQGAAEDPEGEGVRMKWAVAAKIQGAFR